MRCCLAIVLLVSLAACTSNGYFKMAPTTYRQEVKTLGVLPLLVDDRSTILHPDREGVLEVLRRNNAGKTQWLIDRLRGQKDYFDVREISGDPQQLFAEVVASSRVEGDGPGRFRHYDFKPEGVSGLCRRNGVDGLLVVITAVS